MEKLRGQEASHKGQIDKLELDLQRHRDMLREVLTRVLSRVPSAADVSAAVIPPTQCDSKQNEDGAVGPMVSEVFHPDSEEEDDLERNVEVTSIWERRRSGVIKKQTVI